MTSKVFNSVVELNKINYDSTNNRINFSTAVFSNGAPIADETAGLYANSAFLKANAAFSHANASFVAANNVAPQVQPAFDKANAAFAAANSINVYGANTANFSYFALPQGTIAQRPESPPLGAIRFNTSNNTGEIYSSNGWIQFAGTPLIVSVNPQTYAGNSGASFTLTGQYFTPDAQIYFLSSNGTQYLAGSVTYYSNTSIVATTPRIFTVAEEPLSVKIVQQSGTHTLNNAIDCGGVPTWITTAGTLGSVFGVNTVNVYVSATDPENSTINYSLTTGSLPSGVNLTAANGLIQGIASSVTANTTYNFTIRASDVAYNNTDRTFSYTVLNRVPVWNTAAGSIGTYTEDQRTSYTPVTVNAYDPDGGAITYSVSSGSLLSGLTFVSANATITGIPDRVEDNTTATFTVSATDVGNDSTPRTFTMTQQHAIDPNFNLTTLLISPANTSNNSVTNTNFIDNSPNNFQINPSGGVTQGTFTPFAPVSTWSMRSYASGGLQLDNHASIPGQFGTNAFTIECWVNFSGYGGGTDNYIFDTRTSDLNGIWFYYNNNTNQFDFGNTAANQINYVLNRNQWYHIAFVAYGGNTIQVWVDGSLAGTVTHSYNVQGNKISIGCRFSAPSTSQGYFSGLISDFRVTKGVRVYTSPFTRPTEPLSNTVAGGTVSLLTLRDYYLKDYSTNNIHNQSWTNAGFPAIVPYSPFAPTGRYGTTNTGGSITGDGSGDYLSVSSNTAFQYGTGDFTAECWLFLTGTPGTDAGIIEQRPTSTDGSYMLLGLNSSRQVFVYVNSAYRVGNGASATLGAYRWYHIAYSRTSGTGRLYINGKVIGSWADSTNYATTGAYILQHANGGAQVPGHITNVRIVKGTSIYTSAVDFDPPTAPLSAVSGTQLLLKGENGGLLDYSGKNNIRMSSAGVWVSNVASKIGNTAIYFNGSSFLQFDNWQDLTFGYGDFTVECWVLPTVVTGTALMDWRNSEITGSYLWINDGATSGTFGWSGTNTPNGTVTANQWYHLAVARKLTSGGGGTTKIFVNGVQQASFTDNNTRNADRFRIGNRFTNDYGLTGYMDEIRISNFCRYTSNFTPESSKYWPRR